MKKAVILATVGAMALGGFLGRRAGPFFAAENFTVRLAARIALEDAHGLTERTLESEAFRGAGRPAAELYAEAARIQRSFRIGAAFLGAFCGLALGMKALGRMGVSASSVYSIDRDDCLSCARCFLSCPRERLRLKKPAGGGIVRAKE